MKITVILCTYNRCESLATALESVAASTVQASVAWEVLVVDNNSKDRTRQVVEEFQQRYPGRFRYLFEGQPGKSYALNSGIRESDSDVLAFMDDDVTVEPTWLWNLAAPLENGEWGGTGGRILAASSFTPPRWMALEGRYNLGAILALFDLGDKNTVLDRAPFGTNMAYRREVFQKYGGFRVDMGPHPDSEMRNEDTEFGRRVMLAGEKLCYEPSAVVYHAVPEARLAKKYFLEWWFDGGRAAIREAGIRRDLWKIPRYLLTLGKISTQMVVRTLRWLLAIGPQRRFYCKVWVWATAGEILECYQRRFLRAAATAPTPFPASVSPQVKSAERNGWF
jgi:glycosyltransferase involved in cell wall biosynthesis